MQKYRRRLLLSIALIIFLATCLLKFLQLWQPDWLQAIRATLPGRLVLGNSFTWGDFRIPRSAVFSADWGYGGCIPKRHRSRI